MCIVHVCSFVESAATWYPKYNANTNTVGTNACNMFNRSWNWAFNMNIMRIAWHQELNDCSCCMWFLWNWNAPKQNIFISIYDGSCICSQQNPLALATNLLPIFFLKELLVIISWIPTKYFWQIDASFHSTGNTFWS